MQHRSRRVRRAVTTLALGAVAVSGAATISSAPASAERAPHVSVRIVNRTLVVRGGSGNDVLRLSSPATAPTTIEIDLLVGDPLLDPVDATIERADIDRIEVRAGSGNDIVVIDESEGLTVPFSDTLPTELDGQSGDDSLLGGSGAEDIGGGSGIDFIDGNRGNDAADMGSGDDEFIWDPGDGSDTIEGRSGHDVMVFNGSGANETFAAVDDRGRLVFTRNVGNIVMDTDGVEQVDVNALGGSDFVDIDALRRTDVATMNVFLGVTLGFAGADGIVDSVFVTGTDRDEHVTVSGSAGSAAIEGLRPTVNIADADTIDRLLVSTLGGDDLLDASQFGADSIFFSTNTDDGDDVVLGGAGTDAVNTGAGHDVVDGNRGNDQASMEDGDDEFIWDPGDGSDVVAGDGGNDVMTFNGSGGDEVFAAFSLGEDVAFTRDLGNIFMNTSSVEAIDLHALGGADDLTVDDLTGTVLTAMRVDLGATIDASGGDAAVDEITVVGTPGDDAVAVAGAAGAVELAGLASVVGIVDAEPTDTLTYVANGGTDAVDSTGLAPGTIGFSIS